MYIVRYVNKSKLPLYVRRMVREARLIGFGPAFQQEMRLEHFEVISSVSKYTYYRSSYVAHAKIYV